MRKAWGAIFTGGGLILIIWGIMRSNSTASQFAEALGYTDEKKIAAYIVGALLALMGIILIFYSSSSNDTVASQSTSQIPSGNRSIHNDSNFKEELQKIYKLYKNEVMTEEEFNSKKSGLISKIYGEIINESKEDFLLKYISLVEEGNITKVDLDNIKNIYDEKEKLKDLDIEVVKRDYLESNDKIKQMMGRAEIDRIDIPQENLSLYIQYKNYDNVQLIEKYLETFDENAKRMLEHRGIEPIKSTDLAYYDSKLKIGKKAIIKKYVENKDTLIKEVYGR